jgi:hypothetical protein
MSKRVDTSRQMTKRFRPRRRRPPRWQLAAVLSIVLLAPQFAAAMYRPGPDSDLSPRLAELARPVVRAMPPAEQARHLGVAVEGPGSLMREGGRVVVNARFSHGAISALGELREAGAKVLAPSRRYQSVTLAIAPGRLRELSAVPGLAGVVEQRAPLLFGAGATPAAVGATCEGGSILSEGVGQLQVAQARSKYGLDGSGITVGVLSDSYNEATKAANEEDPIATHAGEDVQSGDLSGPSNPCAGEKEGVNVLEDGPMPPPVEPIDEGRAMLQIVHDVAPAAGLAFATAFVSELSFAENIERLAKPVLEEGGGADVIVDDVVWFEEPFFQDGPIAAAANEAVAEGIPYFSAAGNDNLFEGENEIASWETPEFRGAGSCPSAMLKFAELASGNCLDFNPESAKKDTTFGITVSSEETLTVDLQWAQPWYGVETDLDAYLLDSKAENVLMAEDNNNIDAKLQKPVEVLQWENKSPTAKTVQLVVNRCTGVCNPDSQAETPTVKFALLQNGGGVTKTEYPKSKEGDIVGPTIFGHSASNSAVAVAAVPYNNSNTVETYSSRGPVVHLFEPVTPEETPADALPTPEAIDKPDIAATDCGATTFFAHLSGGEWRFCGTSAAAPHAAGIAALQLEAKPSATVEEIREAQAETAQPIGSFDKYAIGAGLLDADAAIGDMLPPPAVTITSGPPSRTTDRTPIFEFESELSAPEFACSIVGIPAATEKPCTSPYTVPVSLLDGEYVFEVEVVGEPPSATFSFTVDTEAPVITITRRPPTPTSDSTPSFSFTTDEPANLTCAVDDGSAQPCASPLTLDALEDGSHSLLITATDQVGNSGQQAVSFEIDTKAPSPAITESPPALSNDPRPSFAFLAGEPVSFVCSIDGEVPEPCASPFEVSYRLADGSHGFEVVATDLAGNSGRATATFAIDATPPQTFISSHPRKFIRASKRGIIGVLRFRANESNVVLACKIDRGLWHFCRTRIRRRFKPGRHTITVKAQDEAGNVDPTPAVYRFVVRHRR